ncbi:hypothetical protein PQR34_09795 [Paraburkholderia sediminicola]|uniref:hypothetical protein n=1 Tax=Paraburkholderia sediminicola TaxID=458836 RepID=UPI000FF8427B
MTEQSVSQLSGARESVLPGVQEHPGLPLGRTGEYARKHATAPHAGVVLFGSRILHGADAVESQVVVRSRSSRLPVQISASCAGLNPEFHIE